MHPGRQVVAGPTVAPSPVPLNSRAPVPHELTVREIEQIVADYARATELRRGRRLRLRRGPRRARLPAVELPLAARQPAHRRLRRRRWRTAPASACRSRARSSASALPLVWRINGDDGIEGGFALEECVQVSRWLQERGRGRDQRHRRHLAHAARHARADVHPARAHAPPRGRGQGRGGRPCDRRRPARRPRAGGGHRRLRRGRPRAARPGADRRAGLAAQGPGGAVRRAAAVHRLQRLRRPRGPRRARALLGQPRGRARADLERHRRADPAARDGRRQRPGGHGGGARSRACAGTTSRSGSATPSSAASSRSPAWRPASARCCASATSRREGWASSAWRSTPAPRSPPRRWRRKRRTWSSWPRAPSR